MEYLRNAIAYAKRTLGECSYGKELYYEQITHVAQAMLAVVEETTEDARGKVWPVLDAIDAARTPVMLAAQLKFATDDATTDCESIWTAYRNGVARRLWEACPPPDADDFAGYEVALDVEQLEGAEAARAFLRTHSPRYLSRACAACGVDPGFECKGLGAETRAVPHESRMLP